MENNCYQSATPNRIEDPCEGKQSSSNCVVFENSIIYLNLPPNSTMTAVVQALLVSLIDARQRITTLEAQNSDFETRITALENA